MLFGIGVFALGAANVTARATEHAKEYNHVDHWSVSSLLQILVSLDRLKKDGTCSCAFNSGMSPFTLSSTECSHMDVASN